MLLAMYQATTGYFFIKNCPISCSLQSPMHATLRYNHISGLCNGVAFAKREKNETPFVYAQMKTHNYSLPAEWANWPQPTGRNPARRSQLVDLAAARCH